MAPDNAVTFDIDMTNMSHGKYLAASTATGGGHYAGDVHFSMGGPWRLIAIVDRPDQEPVELEEQVEVTEQTVKEVLQPHLMAQMIIKEVAYLIKKEIN